MQTGHHGRRFRPQGVGQGQNAGQARIRARAHGKQQGGLPGLGQSRQLRARRLGHFQAALLHKSPVAHGYYIFLIVQAHRAGNAQTRRNVHIIHRAGRAAAITPRIDQGQGQGMFGAGLQGGRQGQQILFGQSVHNAVRGRAVGGQH